MKQIQSRKAMMLERRIEPRPDVWRGIFSPVYDQKVLFSQEVTVRTADLPRWQPHVTIDRRTLEGQTEND